MCSTDIYTHTAVVITIICYSVFSHFFVFNPSDLRAAFLSSGKRDKYIIGLITLESTVIIIQPVLAKTNMVVLLRPSVSSHVIPAENSTLRMTKPGIMVSHSVPDIKTNIFKFLFSPVRIDMNPDIFDKKQVWGSVTSLTCQVMSRKIQPKSTLGKPFF